MSSPIKITVACVAEPSEPAISEVMDLFASLRYLGGSLAQSPGIVFFIGPVSGDIAERFAQLGVQVYISTRFDERCPHANKLRMIAPQPDTDYLIALDTDILIGGDFSSYLTGRSVLAKIVDRDPLTPNSWEQLFSRFDLPLPLSRFLTSFDNSETLPYFNSGVLFIPNELSERLGDTWSEVTRKLLDFYPSLPEISPHRFFTDQFALTLALHSANLPYRALPIELNFPTHMPLHGALVPDQLSPLLIHHHHRRTAAGEVEYCPYKGPNEAITRINGALRQVSRQDQAPVEVTDEKNKTFNNRDFWDSRYFDNPELGSGVGSRGNHSLYKRELVQEFVDKLSGHSILDIGCGDLAIFQDVRFQGDYHGIDISEVIIERNKSAYPDKKFSCLDFVGTDMSDTFSADGVLCFDVLIHQHLLDQYQGLVARLVKATRVRGLVSGYICRPRPAFSSDITAYHEPLTVSLRRFGASNIQVIGAYRDTNIVSFSPPQ